MTTYKLLTDSPLYEKKLAEIKRIAKREKKQISIIGEDIAFVGTKHSATGYGKLEHVEVSGPGAIVQIF
jgi:hypothetical protein